MNQLNIFDTGTNIEKLKIIDGNGKKFEAGTKHKI